MNRFGNIGCLRPSVLGICLLLTLSNAKAWAQIPIAPPVPAPAPDRDAGSGPPRAEGPESGASSPGDEPKPEQPDAGAPVAPAEPAQPEAPPPNPEPAPVAEPPPAPPEPQGPVEVTVVGRPSSARKLQQSAEAVTVVSTRKAKQQTADLGEVLARTQGVNVRREGGLGAGANISLNGLQGEQVRFFVDGVPLWFSGYPFGLANMPVNLVERVEVYRGVVPIRFGADALGGAINVVTDQSYETHLGASYQIGSFGIHRATLGGRYRHEPTGLIAGASAYADVAENDYLMHERPIPRADGSADYRTLPRFHDGYRAFGGNLEVGVVGRRWARKLSVQGFFGTYDKELQHNWVMSVPYGEVTYGESTYGATARYEVELTPELELDAVFNYSFNRFDWRDMATHRYRWNGEQARTVGRDIAPGVPARGEITGTAIDQSLYTHAWFGQVSLGWTFLPGHVARVSVTPQVVLQTGDDHVPNRVDLLGLDQDVTQIVAGVEYELNAFDDRLSNIAFGKLYYQHVYYEVLNDLAGTRIKMDLERDAIYYGGGDGVRYRFTDWLLAKVSYEYATRLPRGVELFGDGVLVRANTALKPERSHNVNLGPRLELRRTGAGDFTVDVNGFFRETKDLIVFLASVQDAPHRNILDVSSRGVEGGASWESPGRYVGLDFSCTYQDIRNSSTEGVFAFTNGRRMPNRPWLFGSAGVRGRAPGVIAAGDAIEPFLGSRYVHDFDRGWALGNPEFKLEMPSQLSHSAGVTYSLTGSLGQVAATFEVDNLSDEALFDVWGVQRPGRSLNFKLSGQI